MWKVLKHSQYETPKPLEVKGSSLTVPGLAPSLIELLEANLAGEGLPMVGQPMYDENEFAGEARVSASQATMAEVLSQGTLFEQAEAAEKEAAAAAAKAADADKANAE